MTTIVELKLNLTEAINKRIAADAAVAEATKAIKDHVSSVINESKVGVISEELSGQWVITWCN